MSRCRMSEKVLDKAEVDHVLSFTNNILVVPPFSIEPNTKGLQVCLNYESIYELDRQTDRQVEITCIVISILNTAF